MPNVLKGSFYYVKDYQHTNKELLYISKSGKNALDNIMQGLAHEGLKTFIYFAIVFTYSKRESPCLNMKASKA
jgi:hypothetical protein